MTKKLIKVDLKLRWVFTEKEWGQHKKHLEELKQDPKQVLGYDVINSLHWLNDLNYPAIIEAEVNTE